MPNPFPGMDPYLEGDLWTTVPGNLMETIARQLVPQVLPKYVVRTERRIVIVPPDPTELPQDRLPDVGEYETGTGALTGTKSVANPPLVLPSALPEKRPQITVVIRDASNQQLVTAIEVLSPTSKRGDGRREYARKRKQTLSSRAHLLEIDLVRVGKRFPVSGELPPAPYFVFLSRANRQGRVEVWPITLSQVLPTVPVPLRPADADVLLDLQAALSNAYELYRYDLSIDYGRPPRGPLLPEWAAYIDERLRQSGRRLL